DYKAWKLSPVVRRREKGAAVHELPRVVGAALPRAVQEEYQWILLARLDPGRLENAVRQRLAVGRERGLLVLALPRPEDAGQRVEQAREQPALEHRIALVRCRPRSVPRLVYQFPRQRE